MSYSHNSAPAIYPHSLPSSDESAPQDGLYVTYMLWLTLNQGSISKKVLILCSNSWISSDINAENIFSDYDPYAYSYST